MARLHRDVAMHFELAGLLKWALTHVASFLSDGIAPDTALQGHTRQTTFLLFPEELLFISPERHQCWINAHIATEHLLNQPLLILVNMH